MNIFLLFLSMFFMIGYYLIASPSQNLGYNEVQYESQNSEMRSLIDCVVAKQNAFINNAVFNDECVKRYQISSTEVCTNDKFELANCSVDPYYDFIITTSYKIDYSQYKDAFRIIDKTRQDLGTLGLFIDPNVIAANSIGKKMIPASVITGAELESGQIAYVIQNSVQTFDPSQPDPDDEENCHFTIFGKICDEAEVNICTGNEIWDEDQKKCVDQTGLCETGKILLIDESDNSYYCVDPTNKTCAGNKTLQYNHTLEAWECVAVENSDDTECDLSQFSLRLHTSLDSAAPTARIRTINCNSCERRVLDESTCTIYCSPDASKLNLGECYNDKLIPLDDCKGENRGIYFGFAPGRAQYAVNTNTADASFQTSDIILNVEKFLDKDHLQDRVFHCFECANGMSDRLSFSPFSAMCKSDNDDDDTNIVCADDEIIAVDSETGKFYCEKMPELPDEPDEPGEPEEPDDPHSYGISLSAYSGITTYPTAATFYVTENTSNGALTVQTSNPKIATASINGSIVTVTPVSKGNVAVYVRSAARGSYNVAVATYNLQISGANIVVNVSDLALDFNGSEQSCANVRVKNPATGAKVGYSLVEEGPYSSAPVLKDAASVTVFYQVSAENYTDLTGRYQCTLTGGQEGGVVLSASSGTITYPTTTTSFTASCLSGGTFSIKNSNPDVASANVDEGTVTLTYNKSGTAYITVDCPEYNGYLSANATYTLTVKKGVIEATAQNKTLTYSGSAQSCDNVSVKSPVGANVTYSTSSGGSYSSNAPTLTNTGNMDVYYKITADNYEDASGSYTCTMNSAGQSTITLGETSGTIIYPNTSRTFDVHCNSGGALSVKSNNKNVATATISGNTVTVNYEAPGATTITVTCGKTSNYDESSVDYTITNQKGMLTFVPDPKIMTYTGSEQSCANITKNQVSSNTLTNFSVKYSIEEKGTYSTTAPVLTNVAQLVVFYKYVADNYNEASGSYKCEVLSTSGSLVLSDTKGTVAFPNVTAFDITQNVSGGALSLANSNTGVVTASLENSRVTLTPQSVGSATITVTSAATSNYGSSSAAYDLTVTEGTITADVKNVSKPFDGSALTCSGVTNVVPSGATVKYKVEGGSYSTTVPTVTHSSDSKTIYYEITASNYNTKTGSFSCSVLQTGSRVITITPDKGEITYNADGSNTTSFTATSVGGGTFTASSNNTNVGTVSINATTGAGTVTYAGEGTATITVQRSADGDFGEGLGTYSLKTHKGTITADVKNLSKTFDGSALICDGVTNVVPSGATVKYSTSQNGTYDKTVPTVTNVSDSKKIYYEITASDYNTKTGSFDCSVLQTGSRVITITPDKGEITYSATGSNTTSFTATSVGGGAFTASSSNENVGTVSINATTGAGTVTYAGEGTATITVKRSADGDFGEGLGTYSLKTHKGTITADVNDLSKTFDGSALTCSGVTNVVPSGATVKYKVEGGSYSTTVPTVTHSSDSKTIYYEITASDYNTKTGSFNCSITKNGTTQRVTITPSSGSITIPTTTTSFTASCLGGGTFRATSSDTGVGNVSINSTSGAGTVTYAGEGSATITVTCSETGDYLASTGTYSLTTHQGTITADVNDLSKTYDGSALTCSGVTNVVPSGATVKYSTSQNGTYDKTVPTVTHVSDSKTIYYEITASDYNTKTGSFDCSVLQTDSRVITIKPSSGEITYNADVSNTTSFTATSVGGGAFTASSSNENVGTVSINATTGAGTVTYAGEGTATITVKRSADGDFGEGLGTYSLTTHQGTIEATAQDKSLTYNGSEQSCDNVKVTSPDDTSITYSTTENGTYTSSAPTLTAASSSRTVYYKVARSNYNTVSGQYTCSMSDVNAATVTLDKTSGTIVIPGTRTSFTANCNSGGALTVGSSNTSVATADINNHGEVIVNVQGTGNATITVYCAAYGSYGSASANFNLQVQPGTITADVNDLSKTYDGSALTCDGVTNVVPSGATVKYKVEGGSYSTTVPTVTHVSDSKTIYYEITASDYNTKTGSFDCSVLQTDSRVITITPSSGEITYNADGSNTTSFTATSVGGGTFTASSSNENVGTVSINATTGAGTVTYAGEGTATITVQRSADGDFGEGLGTYSLTTYQGTIEASAQDKSLTYNGSEQSCENVSVKSPAGTSITYSTTENGTYTSSAPTLTSGSSSTPVYYKVSKTNYTTVSGHYNCTMSSAGSTTTLSSTSGTLYPYESETIEVTCSNNGAVTAVSSNTNVATVDYRKNTVTINYINAGSATITVYCAANNGIDGSSATYSLTNALGTIEVIADDLTLPVDMADMCTDIQVVRPRSGATVTYGEKQGAYSKAYKVTVVGTTTVFYHVTADNYNDLYGQYTCTLEQSQSNNIVAYASDKTLTYTGRPQSCDNVTVTKPASGFTVAYSIDKTSYKDTITVTNSGESKTIYYRVTAPNYVTASGQYTCSVKDDSSTIGCAEPTADCCLENGGSVDDTVESAPTCQILSSAGGTCPSGFTKVSYKTGKQTMYYCEQEIIVK